MLLAAGTQDRVISETTLAAGSTVREGSIISDSLLATLFVSDLSAGTLDVEVFTLTDTGKQISVVKFPIVSGATVNLLLRKSAVSMQRFRVVATYSGVCSYEVYIRAIQGAGESSSKITGASTWSVSQSTVTATPDVLIASTLTDRAGVLIKNWDVAATIYIADTLLKATTGLGYPLAPRDALALDLTAGAAVFAVSDMPTADIRVVQAGG